MATDASGHWNPERLIHRQTYIDLIHAYLTDYGSQHELARALGFSEAYMSFLLTPVRVHSGNREVTHWSVLLPTSGHEIAEAFRWVKTPSHARAQQIANLLCTNAERREALLHYIDLARSARRPRASASISLPPNDAEAAILALGDIHQTALYHSDEAITARSYAQVWHQAKSALATIDPHREPAGHAQALMFLHDAAQVLGRADLALGLARRAIIVTSAADSRRTDDLIRLQLNAMLAEAVSLNSLRLRRQAAVAIDHAKSLPGYERESKVWRRSFLEEQLNSMTGSARASIYGAESTTDAALSLAQHDAILQAGIKRRLMDIYLGRLTGRNMRKADALAESLQQTACSSRISPLRRAQILRTLARYSSLVGDENTMAATIMECLKVTTDANLIHQQTELMREVTALTRVNRTR